jgi:MFS family permease
MAGMRRSAQYKWYVVAMLWFVCLLNYADRQAIFSVFPVLKSQLQLSDLQLGYIASSFMWVYALAAPLAGMIGDRFPRKTIILGGLVFWSLITIATALSVSYWQLVLFRALEGLGEAFYFPASMSMLSAYHGRDTRSRAMSWHQSSVYAGTIMGGAVAGWLADWYGWRSGFYVFGSSGILLGLLLVAVLDEPEQPRERDPSEAFNLREAGRAIFGNPMAVVLMAVFIGANFVAMIFLTWLPSYLNRAFGMSLTMAGLNATAYLQIASVLGVISGGALADRAAVRYRGGRMMTQAMGLFAGVPFLLASGWTATVPMFVLAMTGFGYFKGIYDANIWASLHDVVPVERRATAVGVMNSIGWLGGGVAPLAIAAASGRFGMSACLSATSVIYALFGVLLAAGIARYMRGRPVPAAMQDVYSR